MRIIAILLIALSCLSSVCFADPPNTQRPITFLNSGKKFVKFTISDETTGQKFSFVQVPVPLVPAPVLTQIQSMWHHNIHVSATQINVLGKPVTVDCQPFNGHFSYVQGFLFVASDINGPFECNSVHL